MTSLTSLYNGPEHTLVPGRLRLYRAWGVDAVPLMRRLGDLPVAHRPDTRPALISTGRAIAWPTPEMEARCVNGLVEDDHEAPAAACSCGIYGWYDPHDVRIIQGYVSGVIEAWGRCVLGSNGARVQHARIVALTMPDHVRQFAPGGTGGLIRESMQRMADHGGVVICADYQRMIEAFPPENVREISGEPVAAEHLLGGGTMASHLVAIGTASNQVAQAYTALGVAAAQADLRLAKWERRSRRVRYAFPLVAAWAFSWTVVDALDRRWPWAACQFALGAYNLGQWIFRDPRPWRWGRRDGPAQKSAVG